MRVTRHHHVRNSSLPLPGVHHRFSMSAQLSSALAKLAAFRAHSSRKSQEIVDAGTPLLLKRKITLSDADSSAWLEQLALAAIDVGNLDIADVSITHPLLR